MSQRFYIPFTQIFTNLGAIGPGWKIKTYATGTSTPLATYSDVDLMVANPNPANPLVTSGAQVADSAGRLGDMFVDSSALYKIIMTDENDVTIDTADPVDPFAINYNNLDPRPASFWGTTGGTSSAYTLAANPPITAYSSNQIFALAFNVACSAAPTLDIDGLGPLALKKYTGLGTKVALQEGDIQVQRYWATNDGVDIVILNPRALPLSSGLGTAVTISSGSISLANNSSTYVVDTEGGAASDNLDTISNGFEGEIIILRNASDARNVVVRHNIGNIFNPQNNNATTRDITLDVTTDFVMLRYSSTASLWIVISSSFNNFVNSKGTNGYEISPSGIIRQWGFVNGPSSSGTITFPIPFPTACSSVSLLAVQAAFATRVPQLTSNPGTTSADFAITSSAGSGASASGLYWIAVGY